MICAILFCLSLDFKPEVWIKDVMISGFLGPDQVFQNEAGAFFVLDQQSANVHIFSAEDGSHQRTFGSRGQGPGEFSFPTQLGITKQHLWVKDGLFLSFFSHSGDFIKKTKLPFHGEIVFALSESGLFYFKKTAVSLSWGDERKLFFMKFGSHPSKTIHEWNFPGPRSKKNNIQPSTMSYNPIVDRIFFRQSGTNRFLVFNGHNGTIDKQVEFPYPEVEGILSLPDHNFILTKAFGANKRAFFIVDTNGTPVDSPFKGSDFSPAVSIKENWIYYIRFDEENDISQLMRIQLDNYVDLFPALPMMTFDDAK